MARPYCIASPEFQVTSGGIRVMWGLFGYLLAKGQVVYMNRYPNGDTIAIYPEIYHGNPMNGKTVVRYILNVPGVMGRGTLGTNTFRPGPLTFDPTDKLYYFSKLFGYTDENHYMFLPIINLHLFKDKRKKRTKTCYLIGKGVNRRSHPEGSIELTRQLAEDQEALADLLNECKTLYCYDKLSAMMEVARLCGCSVRYYGDYSEEELEKYEPGMYGITIGDSTQTKFNSDVFRFGYEKLVEEFEDKLDNFIDETQKD